MKNSAVLIGILLISLSVSGQDKTPLTPADIARIKSVGNVEISKNGEWIAYTLSIQANPAEVNEPAHYELHLIDRGTLTSKPFITTGNVRSVSFRPQHQSITFLDKRNEDKYTSLYEISLAGGEALKILEHPHRISYYEWSPDGKKLAFVANEKEEEDSPLPYQPEIYEENLTKKRGYIFEPGSQELSQIKAADNFHTIHWSPQGAMLAASKTPTSLVDDSYMRKRIIFISTTTLEMTGEVDHTAKLGKFSWSPDGKQLAIIAGEDIHDPIDGRLLVVSSKGGKPKNLKPDYPGKFEDILWVDNSTIGFLASQGVHSIMGTIKSNGRDLKTELDPTDPILDEFERAEDGTFVFRAESPVHPHEVYIQKADQNELSRVTNSNPWLESRLLGQQDAIEWDARDGMKIQGILIRPVNEAQSQTYPMITVVHGGPESHYDNGWLTSFSSPGQMAAGNNMIAFYPNYRGSTGRGVEYAKSSQGDSGGKEFDDIVDGVDYLIESGLVDKDKVGVTGASYGGYATGWLSTRYSDRFAAGVMSVGISDNISKWGTSDIPEELYLVHARKRIWEDYDFWLKRSPIYYAGQAKTPLLIMHGKEDTRVHPSQSMELYRHLKTRTDTPVRLIFYPGEGHGNKSSTARFDYSLRMLRWFDNYLKGSDQKLDTQIELEGVTEN